MTRLKSGTTRSLARGGRGGAVTAAVSALIHWSLPIELSRQGQPAASRPAVEASLRHLLRRSSLFGVSFLPWHYFLFHFRSESSPITRVHCNGVTSEQQRDKQIMSRLARKKMPSTLASPVIPSAAAVAERDKAILACFTWPHSSR